MCVCESQSLIDLNARLRYELFRACDNKEPMSIGVWSIERIGFVGTLGTMLKDIFDFTFCECTTCSGCCNYYVTVTPVEIEDGLNVTVGNGSIAAIAR